MIGEKVAARENKPMLVCAAKNFRERRTILSTRPHTIPALKEWNAVNDTYRFGPGTRIVLYNVQLAGTGNVFAEDLRLLSGLTIPVLQDTSSQIGDIVLTLRDADGEQRPQSYYLEIADQVTISANTDDGVFSGTRTVLQLLKQNFSLAGGSAYDWPDYPQRSLMVDVGRQYFSLPWLENHFRDLAYLKYNFFHLHFSDNFGFRLESERHPEIVSQQHYTKAEIHALHELACKYHITIVPEIDVPGHLDAALASHPELLLANERGQRQTGDLNLALEATYTFVQDLLEEYLPLFSGPYWHLGADEYLLHGGNYSDFPQLAAEAKKRYGNQASGKDLYLGFVNWAHEIVKGHGKTTRVWSDGLYGGSAVTPATDKIIYEHWVSWGLTPGEIVARAIPIVNSNIRYLYYVPGSERMTANPAALYEQFEPYMFCLEFNELNNVEGVTVPEGSTASVRDLHLLDHHPLNLGAKLHVWCDNPQVETEEQIAAAIGDALRSLAQKNWGSPKLVERYEDFQPIIKVIGHAPGSTISR
jgi:hexosaminidase